MPVSNKRLRVVVKAIFPLARGYFILLMLGVLGRLFLALIIACSASSLKGLKNTKIAPFLRLHANIPSYIPRNATAVKAFEVAMNTPSSEQLWSFAHTFSISRIPPSFGVC
jgi:hypothetical protein